MTFRVIDAFSFHNEIEVLRLRVDVLKDVVDHFVLVEATKTFRGAARQPWSSLSNEDRFRELLDVFACSKAQVSIEVITDMPDGDDPWVRERHQRTCIERPLAKIKGDSSHDIVLISDCDEIPNPDAVTALKHGELEMPFREGVPLTVAFRQDYHLYSLNWKVPMPWIGTVAVRRDSLDSGVSPQAIRWQTSWQHYVINDGGWHFSWLAPKEKLVERIQEKAASFAHAELDNLGFTTTENIERAIASGTVFWDGLGDGVPRTMVWTDQNLPQCVRDDPERYAHLMTERR